jgi:dephospho-CoA kinase
MTAYAVSSTYIVGLTGGIGSGKSSASELFESLGAYVIDVDVISRSLTAKDGLAVMGIADAFPDVVSNGIIDRKLLRVIAFSSVDSRLVLESILHPLIRAESLRKVLGAPSKGSDYILLVVPLLYESDFYAGMIECSVTIDVDEQNQVSRIIKSRDLDSVTAAKIIKSQTPRDERLRRAQFVIDNRGDVASLAQQVGSLHRLLGSSADNHSKLALKAL